MPPYKQPPLLRDLALQKAAEFIGNTCMKISNGEKRLRTQQERDKCYDKASRLREYLVPIIRPLMDEICAYGLLDYEVWLSTFMHQNMKSLTCRKNPSYIESCLYHTSLFWDKHLINVPNLKELELFNDLDHERPLSVNTFKIISQNCHHLEIIKFDSRYIKREAFNYLKNIKSLRIIKDIGGSFPCVRFVEFFGGLLENLPRLEYLSSCTRMGEVLAHLENVSSVLLTEVRDYNPTLKGVEAIVRLCPNLKSLHMEINADDECDHTLTYLTESSLEITTLKLTLYYSNKFKFSFRPTVANLFYNKGVFIKSLTICSWIPFSCEHMITIGKNCPELEEFSIYSRNWGPEINPDVPHQASQSMFLKLVTFTCFGVQPILVKVCLRNAVNIQCIHISNYFPEGEIRYKLISEIIKGIHKSELQSLYLNLFGSEYIVSQDLIIYIWNAFPKLVKLSLLGMEPTPELRECVQSLREEILHKNLDLDFRYTFKGR